MRKKYIPILFSCKIVDRCGTIALNRLFDGKGKEIIETLKVTILHLRLENIYIKNDRPIETIVFV